MHLINYFHRKYNGTAKALNIHPYDTIWLARASAYDQPYQFVFPGVFHAPESLRFIAKNMYIIFTRMFFCLNMNLITQEWH